ncbi:MAG TPA: hypothetical protein VLY24_27580 [Bryobacteraceae bacterium]|nr:hypothetical protein [Bryobacteraceae bacterium]
MTKYRLVVGLFVTALTALAQPAGSSQLWQDPREGAFSVQLPAGWLVSGGTVRKTRIEPHYIVRAQSPDGGVQLFMDDPDLLIHQVPDRRSMAMGIREGAHFPAAWGGTMILDRFRSGADVAAMYVRQRLCTHATQLAGGLAPDQTRAANAYLVPIAAAEGKQLRADAGEVEFRCGDRLGYVHAVTFQVWDNQGISLWVIYRIAGYLARPQSAAAANQAVQMALASFQMNPAWLEALARESGDIAGNVIRESNAITQAVMERAKAEQAVAAAASASRVAQTRASAAKHSDGNGSDYNQWTGTKRVCDDLDRCQPVDASVTNWWSDCSGTFHPGAESGAAPSPSASTCWHRGH